jgi:beta-mannosidase
MTLDGKVVTERSQSMRVDPLSTKIYYAPLFPEMLGKLGVNPATVFVDADLAVNDQTVSTNVLYLVPTRQIHLPPAQIDHTLAPVPGKEGP